MPDPLSPGDSLLIAAPQHPRSACFSLPAVRALLAQGLKVTLLCPDSQSTFWSRLPSLSLLTYPSKARTRHITPLLSDTSRALIWEPGPAADAIVKAGTPTRIGLPSPRLAKQLTLTLERTLKPGPTQHQVRSYLDVAQLLGADPFDSAFFSPLKAGVTRDPEAILILPDSDFGGHYEWPLDRWKTVTDHIRSLNHEPSIVTTPDGELGPELASLTGCPTLAVDPADPRPLATAGLCLSADATLPHFAAAFGTTCAVLFGPADPDLTRPLGKHHLVIRRKVECSPCFLDRCPFDLRCQNDLEATAVIRALSSFS